MRALWSLTVALACVWIVSLLCGEMIFFWLPRWTCSWPELQEKSINQTVAYKPIKVALIADPQLTDRTSHGMAPGSLALRITEFYSDIFMRRAFRSSVLGLEPDEIIFLGDQFDGGPYLTDSEWEDSLKRFYHVFDQSERGIKSRSKREIPVHYLVGNHDLGYHETFAQNSKIIKRYRDVFGPTDYSHKIGGVEFIFVNAQALDGARSETTCNSSWSFIEQLATSTTSGPKILLTHIPLYRPNDTPCGPERASRVINQRLRRTSLSSQRITYLTNESSLRLLNLTNPIIVFSGHDHDHCKVSHATHGRSYPEYTVGTFSWQQGNIYPSFMMLSVIPGPSADTDAYVAEKLCFLPAQDFVYAWYAVLFVISIVALFSWPVQGLDLWPAVRRAYTWFKNIAAAKEKDEDTEWEMVWDAEGGMHLISKGHSQNGASQHGQSSDRRGTVVQRAAAKAKAMETAPTIGVVESSENSSNKSKILSLRGRTIQMAGPLVVLLTVNLSLYMILVTKDWA